MTHMNSQQRFPNMLMLVACLAALLGYTCFTSPPAALAAQPPTLTTIQIMPASVSLPVGSSQLFEAGGRDQYGNPYLLSKPLWFSGGGGTLVGTLVPMNGTSVAMYTVTTPGTYTIACREDGTEIVGLASVTNYTPGGTATSSPTRTFTPTPSRTATRTATPTQAYVAPPTPTQTVSPSAPRTFTPEPTASPTKKPTCAVQGVVRPANAPNRVIKNGVGQNTRHGIVLAECYGNIIGGAAGSENTIVRNGGNGLRLEDSNPASGRGNVVSHNLVGPGNKDGVVLEGVTGHDLKQLAVQGNTGNGIQLIHSPYNRILDNPAVQSNVGNGLYLTQSDQVQIHGTEARNNMANGILLERSNQAVIGLRDKPVKAIANKEHGVQLAHCSEVVITSGEYSNNIRDGIQLNSSTGNRITGRPVVQNNGGNGIVLNGSSGNVLQGDPIGFQPGGYRPKPIYYARVLTNGGVGIHLNNSSNGNHIENFLVQRHSYGVLIESSNNNIIQWNQVVTARICINKRGSTGNKYTVNTFLLCGLPASPSAHADADYLTAEAQETLGSLLVEGGAPTVTGNVFEEDAGDAVTCQAGAAPVLHKNSLVSIAGFGMVNTTPLVTVDARDNWWGYPSGPGGEGPGSGVPITGTILFEPWYSITVSVVVDASPGVVYAPRGITSIYTVAVFDWDWPGNELAVTVTDALGRLAAPGTFTVSGVDIAGVGIPITFTVPAGAALGATDTVTVLAASAHGARDTDTFRIIAAAGADLALTATVQPPQLLAGLPVQYTLVATNGGPDLATSVVLSDTLPAGLTFVSAQASQGTCVHNARVVTCALGNLAPQASAAVTVLARADLGMSLNRAMVTSALRDPDMTNNEVALYGLVRTPPEHIYLPVVLHK